MTNSLKAVKRKLQKAYKRYNFPGGGGWRSVGKDFDVSPGTCHRMATDPNYEPTNPVIRAKFGMSTMLLASACNVCGKVHLKKRCPNKSRSRDLFETPLEILRWKLQNREEVKNNVHN